LPIIERANLVEELRHFPGNSFATAMDGESLYAQDLSGTTAFVFGNEGAGLRTQTIAAASKRVTIPMAAKGASVESLNAGAAAAICLFERKRQAEGL
jgi:TrmH family RNA methyltransferase